MSFRTKQYSDIGLMQGRLSPRTSPDVIQEFPVETWRSEFPELKEIGFGQIELVLDAQTISQNPLLYGEGRAELKDLASQFDILIRSVCCDVFVDEPFIRNETINPTAMAMLSQVLDACLEVDISFVEIPFLGQNSLSASLQWPAFFERVRELDFFNTKQPVKILLETDLPPRQTLSLMSGLDKQIFGLNFDMGNSQWFGFNPISEIELLFDYIEHIHVKDCDVKHYSNSLGHGSTPLKSVLSALVRRGYKGSYVIQAGRGADDYQTAQNALMES